MSKDDIIKNWKDPKKTKNTEDAPANPIGDPELPESQLEAVAGGTDVAFRTEGALTVGCCTTEFCPTLVPEKCQASLASAQ